MNLLSCIGRQEQEGPAAETPNIDQIRAFLSRFQNDPNTDKSFISRPNSTELCEWSKKVCEYLPSVDDQPAEQANNVKQHFSAIKQFYNVIQQQNWTQIPAPIQTFFNSLQIYETISGLACIMFEEHPDIMKVIENQLQEAREAIEQYRSVGFIGLLCCGSGMILARFNTFLRIIDEKLQDLGIGRLLEFLQQLLDVFCKYFQIDMSNIHDLQKIAQNVRDLIAQVGQKLSVVFGRLAITGDQRSTDDKFAPLEITGKIHRKLSKFGTQAPIVDKALTSFERFYTAINKVDDNLIRKQQQLKSSSQPTTTEHSLRSTNDTVDPDFRRENALQLETTSTIEEVSVIGKMMQSIELVLTYGILILKNEDDVLKPLSDHVDDCTKILETYAHLHPLYKIICGKNYLSKLKVFINKIVDLLKSSKLKLNSPDEFLQELKERYPDLLRFLADDLIEQTYKKHIADKLPESVENILDDAMKNIMGKFSSKF
ncbi:unnamed protein product [Didymodactylos carnosus]|uniref:Uncharacterized protein n=1 Tax=Didymodactylos carnosus TaxID=1234261 RepID=A0A813QTA3_9BILA|nr:unnamed protein product [Didymodactylos carnosus]CAF1409336.1 unnamed protein product [Didymodactylos carnosus]CAF3555181.1 unnamed protein product [Didymodactylos carnosus]CAF4213951.1 unnamed protein product [Didymodactylos carnosus]